MRLRSLLLVSLVLCAALAPARERTFRLITFYDTSQAERAGTQNFDVVQDERGIIYVGNLAGVLAYDGVRWRVIGLPHEAPALRLKIAGKGVIAVGSTAELGYLERDETGSMRYVSLTSKVPVPVDDLEQIVDIDYRDGATIYSFSSGILLRWDGRALTQIPTNEPPRTTYAIGNNTVVTNGNLRTIVGNQLVPVPGSEIFAKRRVRHLLPWSNGTLLTAIAREGLFIFDGKTAQPFAPQLSARVVRDGLADWIPLAGDRLAIVTRRGGVIIIRNTGEVEEIVDATTGLPDSDINHGYLDADGALWLAMDNGLSRVDVSSPLTLIDSRGGLRGSAESVLRVKGTLWVGTTSGLYRITSNPESRIAQQVGAAQRMTAGWALVAVGDEILCGTNDAVYVIRVAPPTSAAMSAAISAESAEPHRLESTDSTTPYALLQSKRDPNLVYAGTDRGLLLLRREASGWTTNGLIEDTPPMIRQIVEEPDGSIWLGTSFNGVTHVTFTSGKPQLRHYGQDAIYPFHLAGRLVFLAGSKQLCSLHAGRFTTDPILGSIGDGDEISAMAEDPEGRIWVSTRTTGVAIRGRHGKYVFQPRTLAAIPGTSVDAIYPDADGVIWFGSERGLVRFDSHSPHAAFAAPRQPLIRDVALDGKAIGAQRVVHFGRGRLRFDVAAATYDGGTMYQYRLDPVDAAWGAWTDEPFTEFTNLWEGDYRLLVRTKNIRGAMSKPIAIPFRVLPPWYRTPWAWALWALLVLAAMGAFSRLRTRAFRLRAAMLEKRVAEQTHELRDAVEQLRLANARLEELSFDDPLTGIANRRQFDETLRAEWSRARRTRAPLAMVFIDIDWFKALNDTHGHHVGDECLKSVANFLNGSVQRASDLVARIGGEEFALILPNTQLHIAAQFAERLRHGITALGIPHETAPNGLLTASFGVVSVIPEEGTTPEDAVKAADRALYMAKA
ncbi:MAG TPA: diguanylate cyclase, partial [Thermoanaerobaculia bacterium]|nr:diguanylate cyclase [Thermoanaerobaculia bacterium]